MGTLVVKFPTCHSLLLSLHQAFADIRNSLFQKVSLEIFRRTRPMSACAWPCQVTRQNSSRHYCRDVE